MFASSGFEQKSGVEHDVGSSVCVVPGCSKMQLVGQKTCSPEHTERLQKIHTKFHYYFCDNEGKCPKCESRISGSDGMGKACGNPQHVAEVLADEVVRGLSPPEMKHVDDEMCQNVSVLVASAKEAGKKLAGCSMFCGDCKTLRHAKDVVSDVCTPLSCAQFIKHKKYCVDCKIRRSKKEMDVCDCLYLGCKNLVADKLVGCCLCHHNAIAGVVLPNRVPR